MVRKRWFYYVAISSVWAIPLVLAGPHLLEANPDFSAGFGLKSVHPVDYWMTQAWVLLYYVRLCFVPYPQYIWYRDIWPMTTTFADFWPAGLVIALLMLLTAGLLLWRHWLGFLGLWFFSILSVTSLIPLLDSIFEHRLYLPLAAFCVIVVMTGNQLLIGCVALLSRYPKIGSVSVALFSILAAAILIPVLFYFVYEHDDLYLPLVAICVFVGIVGQRCWSLLAEQKYRTVLATTLICVMGITLISMTLNRNEAYYDDERMWQTWNDKMRTTTEEPLKKYFMICF